jgi:hypothetical protein
VLEAVHRADRGLALYAPDDIAIAPDLPARAGGAACAPGARRRRLAWRGADARVEQRFREAYGRDPDRQAVLGFEAMGAVLRGIARAGARADSRREVIAQALGGLGTPRAAFTRFRVQGDRLVPIR